MSTIEVRRWSRSMGVATATSIPPRVKQSLKGMSRRPTITASNTTTWRLLILSSLLRCTAICAAMFLNVAFTFLNVALFSTMRLFRWCYIASFEHVRKYRKLWTCTQILNCKLETRTQIFNIELQTWNMHANIIASFELVRKYWARAQISNTSWCPI